MRPSLVVDADVKAISADTKTQVVDVATELGFCVIPFANIAALHVSSVDT
jgi:hypothetical protein